MIFLKMLLLHCMPSQLLIIVLDGVDTRITQIQLGIYEYIEMALLSNINYYLLL